MKAQDLADLKQLIEFLKEHQVAEFDLDRGDVKIRLKFKQPESSSSSMGDLTRLLASAPPVVSPVVAASTETPSSSAPDDDTDAGLHQIKSPMVGTFCTAPSPDAASFVAVGDRVEKGQVVAIVEAMKLMNEIESDASGEILKCLVSNGQPVEYGQPLFSIRLG
jgi:acetyl-CoA carboxylase biotin carboxyl carrier protein